MPKTVIFTSLSVVITMILTTIFQPLSFLEAATQQETCRVFRETDRAVCGKFLKYWDQHGGLFQFGYPISNVFTEISDLDGQMYPVQYFERAVFELHVENKPPYDVLLSQLGSIQYKSKYSGGNPEGNYPLYPNAEDIRVERSGNLGSTTTFQTSDTPQEVLSFYKDALTKTGWRLSKEQANSLGFYYVQATNQASNNPNIPKANYEIDVDIVNVSGGRTLVRLETILGYRR